MRNVDAFMNISVRAVRFLLTVVQARDETSLCTHTTRCTQSLRLGVRCITINYSDDLLLMKCTGFLVVHINGLKHAVCRFYVINRHVALGM